MKPDKIYLPWEYAEIDVLPPGVTTKQVFGKDVCYIRKDYLLEWAKEHQEATQELHASSHDDYDLGHRDAFLILIDKLEEI